MHISGPQKTTATFLEKYYPRTMSPQSSVRLICWGMSENGFGTPKARINWSWGDHLLRLYVDAYELPPLTRDPFTGFRVAAYIDPAIDLEQFLEPPDLAFTDFRDAQPASIEVFEAIRDQFSYSSESTDESNPIWDLEIVSINTDYDDDRVRIHLFKPKDQTRSDPVIHVSGLSTFSAGAQMVSKPLDFDFIISSGRTLIILELDGSYSDTTD